MVQFDVHRYPGKLRDVFPFVVVVQSSLYESYPSRVVVPLVRKSLVGTIFSKRLNLAFTVDDTPVILQPLEITTLPVGRLGNPVDSLVLRGDEIMAAIDELITLVGK